VYNFIEKMSGGGGAMMSATNTGDGGNAHNVNMSDNNT
jgi:hypothetical protein